MDAGVLVIALQMVVCSASMIFLM